MKVAVIGSRGFVGSSIYNFLKNQNYDVVPVTRDTLDVLNFLDVKQFLLKQKFDVIVNCAAIMTDNSNIHDTRNNLGMFINFWDLRHLFKKFINTGSGAEFDREYDIDQAQEELIFQRLPRDSYGFGQNLKSRLCYTTDNFYTLRIFNCFGSNEQKTRLFPRILESVENFNITNDRYFDYFYIKDLCTLVENCMINDWKTKDINCVYPTKYKISQVTKMFCDVNMVDKNIVIQSTSDKNYTGSAYKLQDLNIDLLGLEFGLKDYLKKD